MARPTLLSHLGTRVLANLFATVNIISQLMRLVVVIIETKVGLPDGKNVSALR